MLFLLLCFYRRLESLLKKMGSKKTKQRMIVKMSVYYTDVILSWSFVQCSSVSSEDKSEKESDLSSRSNPILALPPITDIITVLPISFAFLEKKQLRHPETVLRVYFGSSVKKNIWTRVPRAGSQAERRGWGTEHVVQFHIQPHFPSKPSSTLARPHILKRR